MPRVHHVKKARKAHRKYNIAKGDEYFWWWGPRPRIHGARGIKLVSKTTPRRSQLAVSPYFKTLYGIQEAIEDAVNALDAAIEELELNSVDDETGESVEDEPENVDDLKAKQEELADVMEQAAEDIDALAEECTTSRDNMPESLRESGTGEVLQQRADGCTAAAEALREAALKVRELDNEDLATEGVDAIIDEVDWSGAEE